MSLTAAICRLTHLGGTQFDEIGASAAVPEPETLLIVATAFLASA
jgi:hypothetical protein